MTRQQRHTDDDHMPFIPIPGFLANLAVQAGAWLRRMLRVDHSSLYGGEFVRSNAGRRHIYITVACAPSRRLRRPRRVTPSDALTFLNGVVPQGFAPPPAESTGQGVA